MRKRKSATTRHKGSGKDGNALHEQVSREIAKHYSARAARQSWFTSFAHKVAHWAGKPVAFLAAFALIVAWGASGPLFGFSDTWQLVVNTATTIVTFLMVFLIQNTQNRDTEAIQIKLDELIRATKGAHNALLDLEELEEESIAEFRRRYQQLAAMARDQRAQGAEDTGTPEA